MFSTLAIKSLISRKGSVLLSILAMTVSIYVMLGVENLRHQVKESFANTVSGVDLIVGGRTGGLNLLLYSVFRIGSPTNNVTWTTFETIAQNPKVQWAIPISLGDSHKGYRVMGTTTEYFKYFNYGRQHPLTLDQGSAFSELYDVVLGADVARKLGYSLGDRLVLSHGIGKTSFSDHADSPFTVVGILKPTGTPVDQTLMVSLQAIEAIHEGYNAPTSDLEPKQITAFMLGLNSKLALFKLQREINQYRGEPLTAIMPGIALSELWQMVGVLESTLRLVSLFVFISAVLGLSAMLLASIRDRKREIDLLRVMGASPMFLFFLIEVESLVMTLLSIGLAAGLLFLSLLFSQAFLLSEFGLFIGKNFLTISSAKLLLLLVVVAGLASAVPSISAYWLAKRQQ